MTTRRSRILLLIALLLAAGILYEATRDPGGAGPPPVRAATAELELAFGLHATLTVAAEYAGLSADDSAQNRFDQLASRFMFTRTIRGVPYPFDFHILADTARRTALTIPGGQIFVTAGLLGLVQDSTHTLALLAHQVGHGVARHSVRTLSGARLGDDLTGAMALARFQPESVESRRSRETARAVEQLLRIQHTVAEELEADSIAIELLREGGIDPRALPALLRRVEAVRPTEYLEVHPHSPERLARADALAARHAGSPAR